MKSKAKITLAYCTFPDQATAEQICTTLVAEGTIACANILPPMKSVYLWKDQLQSVAEVAALLKTRITKRESLKERIRATHPYENPCLVFFSVDDGLPEFLNWVWTQSL